MSTFEIIRKIIEASVTVRLDDAGNLRLRRDRGAVPPELVDIVKENKSEIVAYIQRSESLRVGMRVSCPNGEGRVFEVYPSQDRCGVFLDTYSWPQFFRLMEVIPSQNFNHKTK